jgi:hypothetical protein
MKVSEFRNLIREEVRKVLKESLKSYLKHGDRVWGDGQYEYTVDVNEEGKYEFIVIDIKSSKVIARFLTKSEINKIKKSPYYDAYVQVRDAWNPDPYGSKNPLFGY